MLKCVPCWKKAIKKQNESKQKAKQKQNRPLHASAVVFSGIAAAVGLPFVKKYHLSILTRKRRRNKRLGDVF